MKRITGLLCLILILSMTGCSAVSSDRKAGFSLKKEEPATAELFAMDTYMTFTAYGEHGKEAVEAAKKEVQRLDELLSTGSEKSEITLLNNEGRAEASEEVLALLSRSLDFHEQTGGLFDCSIYPLMELWGFAGDEYYVPGQEEIDALLPLVDSDKIQIEGNRIILGERQKIDFGGIAKGYTSQALMELYRSYGVTSGMVYLGGNVQTLGTKPDGTRWRIGIQDPSSDQGELLLVVEVSDEAVITSGGYERYFEQDGKTYIHIVDPRTGYPAENDLLSVTIIASDGTMADALSTSLFLMGRAGAEQFWREHAADFEMVIVTTEQEILVTDGLQKRMHCDKKFDIISMQDHR